VKASSHAAIVIFYPDKWRQGKVFFNISEALINSSMNYQSTKKGKCDFPFFFIFNDLLVIENGSTSLCCGNSELIRVSLEIGCI